MEPELWLSLLLCWCPQGGTWSLERGRDYSVITLQAPRYHHLPATAQPSSTPTKGASGPEVLPKQFSPPSPGCPEDGMAAPSKVIKPRAAINSPEKEPGKRIKEARALVLRDEFSFHPQRKDFRGFKGVRVKWSRDWQESGRGGYGYLRHGIASHGLVKYFLS